MVVRLKKRKVNKKVGRTKSSRTGMGRSARASGTHGLKSDDSGVVQRGRIVTARMVGNSMVMVIPVELVSGMELEPGTKLQVEFDKGADGFEVVKYYPE